MKKFKVKFIKEEAIVQPAVVASDVNTQEESLDDVAQETNLVANTTPTLQEQDVDKLEDKDVMNYVYFNTPDDIDEGTRQALFNRADQIRQKQMNGSTTPKDQEEFAKGVIAAAAQSRNKAKLGEAYTSGRVDTFDEPSWADMDGHFDDEDDDATYRPSYIPTQTSDEFMKSSTGQRSKLLWDLKDAVADKVEELSDGEFDYENVYDFVSDYLDKAHAKYSGEELKKHARVYDSKVDFFAKIIRMKLRNKKATEEQEEMDYNEDVADMERELAHSVVYELENEFGYDIDRFGLNVDLYVGKFLKSNPQIFKTLFSKKNRNNLHVSGADVRHVLQEILPNFKKHINFLKKTVK